jgi:hypothetical protein
LHLGAAGLLLCPEPLSAQIPPATPPAPAVVIDELGMAQGFESPEHPGVAVFRGLPYAQPPTDELRWQPPAPHRGWKPKVHNESHLLAGKGGPVSCGTPQVTLLIWCSMRCIKRGPRDAAGVERHGVRQDVPTERVATHPAAIGLRIAESTKEQATERGLWRRARSRASARTSRTRTASSSTWRRLSLSPSSRRRRGGPRGKIHRVDPKSAS